MTKDSPEGVNRPQHPPVRVLMVTMRFPEVEGGVDAMVRDLTAALGARAEVSVFVPGDWTDRRLTSRRVEGVTRHALRLRMPFDRRRPVSGFLGWCAEVTSTVRALVRLLRETGTDVVHLHTVTNYAAYFRIAGRLARVPYVITLHGSDVTAFPARDPDERWLIRWALAGAARVAAVSAGLADLAERRFGLARRPVVIRNGISLDLAAADAAIPSAAPGRFVLSAGALDHVKGHDVLLRAWASLAAAYPDTTLVIAGEGECGAELRRLAGELGCAGRVAFAGALERREVIALMGRAELFVLPSRNEGLGLVLLEAGLAGCPVVASDVGGVGEIVSDGETGLLVPSDDPQALAAAVDRALGDPGVRRRLAGNLQARVRAEFGSAGMADAYLHLYRQCLRPEAAP